MIINVARLLARSPLNERALLSALPHMMACMPRHLEHEGLQESGVGLLGTFRGRRRREPARADALWLPAPCGPMPAATR
jgi:hypothetical protein